MDGNHVHVVVRGLDDAVAWFARVLEIKPTFTGSGMAVLPFGPIGLILDEGAEETIATIGYASADCDADFRTVTDRGAEIIEEPQDRPWGVRAAYLKGPGRLIVELEQPLQAAGSDAETATWDARAWIAGLIGCERSDLTVRSTDQYGPLEKQVRYERAGEPVARLIVRGPILPIGVQPGHGHRVISAQIGSGMQDSHSIDVPESQAVIY
jgi:predicted enzyme related to lactoylglutathione lyase